MASPHTSRSSEAIGPDENNDVHERNMRVCSESEAGSEASPSTTCSKREKCVEFLKQVTDFLASEEEYLNRLHLLRNYFAIPLMEQTIIDGVSHSKLFKQIDMIYNLTKRLKSELERDMNDVAGVFYRISRSFEMYSTYAFDYSANLLLVHELTVNNERFHKFLLETESHPELQFKLQQLMISPIHCMPRYRLFLQQILRHTSIADADFKKLKASMRKIENTIGQINTCVANHEAIQNLINLQNSMVDRQPNIVNPTRRIIREGKLDKVLDKGVLVPRYCVLFTDIFLYCKMLKERPSNAVVADSLHCYCLYPLHRCEMQPMAPDLFKIIYQNDDAITVYCSDVEECRQWVGDISDAIDLYAEQGNSSVDNFEFKNMFRNADDDCIDSNGTENEIDMEAIPEESSDARKPALRGILKKRKLPESDNDANALPYRCVCNDKLTTSQRSFDEMGELLDGPGGHAILSAFKENIYGPPAAKRVRFSDELTGMSQTNVQPTEPTPTNQSNVEKAKVPSDNKRGLFAKICGMFTSAFKR